MPVLRIGPSGNVLPLRQGIAVRVLTLEVALKEAGVATFSMVGGI